MEAFLIEGMSLISFFLSLWLITFSHHLIFKLAIILSVQQYTIHIMQIFLDFFFFNIFHQIVIFFSSKLDPDLGLAITYFISEVSVFENGE